MQIIIVGIFILWSVRLVINLSSYVHLWYVKEYRWDRMWIHLHTKQGKRILFPARRMPPLALKTVALFFSTFLISCFFLFYFRTYLFLGLFIMDVVLFPVTAILVLIMKIPTAIYHEYQISKGLKKLHRHSPMTVIGVTGSFGKTSVKENLATILGTKYHVLKTEASKNSPIGIAETTLKNLSAIHDVFVVEMGAYKRGEIARMTAMVKPEIGIVTAINAQHQDLFGTIEQTIQAKYELIAGLTGRRIAIINADNEYTRRMIEWARRDRCTVWVFTKERTLSVPADKLFSAVNIHADLQGISFDVEVGKERASVSTKILGVHQVSNILAAIAGSVAAGMTVKEAASAASEIQPVKKTLELVSGVNGSLFINDTFNNNPDAAKAALAVLAKSRGRKILVFQPMIELGSSAKSSHKDVGVEAGKVCDAILLTNDNFSDDFIAGVRSVNPDSQVSVFSPFDTAQFIRNTVNKDDAVLFKGKEAEFAFRLLP